MSRQPDDCSWEEEHFHHLDKEIEALKAQVNETHIILMNIQPRIGSAVDQYPCAAMNIIDNEIGRALSLTSEQCLNSVKADAIEVFARDCSESSLKLNMSAMEYCDNLLRGK